MHALLSTPAFLSSVSGALLGAEQLLFHELWVAARPRLSAVQLAAGREQSVYPAQAEDPLQPRAPRLQPGVQPGCNPT